MCEEHKIGGLRDDPERLERYQKLLEEAFPGKTALDIVHRSPVKHAKKMWVHRGLDKITCGKCKQEMKEVELGRKSLISFIFGKLFLTTITPSSPTSQKTHSL